MCINFWYICKLQSYYYYDLLCHVLRYQYPFWVTGPSLFDLKLFGFSNHKQDTAEVAKEFHRYGHRQTWVFGGSENVQRLVIITEFLFMERRRFTHLSKLGDSCNPIAMSVSNENSFPT